MPVISIVIPNYNGARLLPACLASVQSGSDCSLRVIIVDDGSRDASLDVIMQQKVSVECIVLPENRMFAHAANVGIEHALQQGCDYVFLLNSDTQLTPESIPFLVSFMEKEPEVIASQPVLLDMAAPRKIMSAGVRCSLTGRGWDHLMGHNFRCDGPDGSLILSSEIQKPFSVLGCTGGAVLFRASSLISLLEHRAIFDTSLGMYLEDLDFALQIQRTAEASPFYCVPQATVTHKGGASTDSLGTSWKVALTEKNAVLMVLRYYPAGWMITGVTAFMATSVLMAGIQMVRGQAGVAKAILSGGWKGVKQGLKHYSESRNPLSHKQFMKLVDWRRIIPPSNKERG